jgi:hypothetical protein
LDSGATEKEEEEDANIFVGWDVTQNNLKILLEVDNELPDDKLYHHKGRLSYVESASCFTFIALFQSVSEVNVTCMKNSDRDCVSILHDAEDSVQQRTFSVFGWFAVNRCSEANRFTLLCKCLTCSEICSNSPKLSMSLKVKISLVYDNTATGR